MLYFILFVGTLLRLSFINKPEGLWNDEYVSWYVANTPFGEGFWHVLFKQCHMPLYYLYLKPFAQYSDVILRLTSVVPSLLAVVVMYYVGKEYSRKVGLVVALVTSCLSFLVYYSQEVRFYSIVFLLSGLLLLFTIKILKSPTKRNYILYSIAALLLVFTHVLGIIFVIFNTVYILYKRKNKNLAISLGVVVLLLFPIGIHILNMLPSSQWWGNFSYTNILFLFTDFLSPVLTNNVNAPAVFFYNKSLAIWLVLPPLLVLFPIIKGVLQEKGLAIVSTVFVLTLSLLALSGNLVFITKYSMEVLPTLILLLAIGVDRLSKTGLVLLLAFITMHLAMFFTPNYVTKIPRNEGNRIPAEILKARRPDCVVFTYYEPNRFYRYLDLNGKKVFYISKTNRLDYLETPSQILKDVKKGETVSVVFLDSVSFFSDEYLKMYDNNKLPEMFVTFSKIRNELVSELNKDYTDFKLDRMGYWTIITARRNN